MSLESDLDPYCRKILTVLITEKDEIRLNKLHKKIREEIPLSRPTLNSHLKELVEKKYILKRIDEQSKSPLKPTYYSFNQELGDTFLGKLYPEYTNRPIFKIMLDRSRKMEKMSLQELSMELARTLFIGDLLITKLYLESLKANDKKSKILKAVKNFLLVNLDYVQVMLLSRSAAAKDSEIDEMIKVIDDWLKTANGEVSRTK